MGTLTTNYAYLAALTSWAAGDGIPARDAERYVRGLFQAVGRASGDETRSLQRLAADHETSKGNNGRIRTTWFDQANAATLERAVRDSLSVLSSPDGVGADRIRRSAAGGPIGLPTSLPPHPTPPVPAPSSPLERTRRLVSTPNDRRFRVQPSWRTHTVRPARAMQTKQRRSPHDVAGAAEAERRLGIRLPSDYITFIETYRAGGIGGGSLWIPPPYRAHPEAAVWSTWPNSSGNGPRVLLPLAARRSKCRHAAPVGFIEDGTHLF